MLVVKGVLPVRNHIEVIDIGPMMSTLKATCSDCGKEERFFLPTKSLQNWVDGAHIQNVFPDLNADQREILISGICGECFDKMFGKGNHE